MLKLPFQTKVQVTDCQSAGTKMAVRAHAAVTAKVAAIAAEMTAEADHTIPR